MNIPQHVAIILDGNGRWAKSKGMPRNYGHARGAKNLEKICRDAYDIGIKYLTVYLFSTENWKRSREEVDGLMKLFRSYTKTCIKTARENNMKVRVLGDPTALADDLQESLKELVESSKNNTGLNFNLAINYGSRDDDRAHPPQHQPFACKREFTIHNSQFINSVCRHSSRISQNCEF